MAEVFQVSDRSLSLALHLAAGIVLAVVGIELMPEALEADPPWVPLIAFVAGGAVFIGLDSVVGYVQGRLGGSDDQTSDCTHTYTHVPDPPATTYPASATLTWNITYTATGQPGGDLGTNATTTTFELTVTERQAVVCYDTPAEDCNPT